MGGSSSKSKVSLENNTYVTNQSTINQLSETINETIVNVTLENVKNSSASLLLANKIVITGIKAGEDITIVSMQGQQGMLDFLSIQIDTVTSTIQDSVEKAITNKFNSIADTGVVQKMDAEAQAKTEQGWGAIGWAQSNSAVKQKVVNDIKNISTRNFATVVKMSVESNFTQKNLSTCVSTVAASQEFKTSNLVAGRTVSLTLNQEQAVSLFTKCIQQSDVANQIMKNINEFYNMKVTDDYSTQVETSQTGKSSASTIMAGIFDNLLSYSSFGMCCSICIIFIIIWAVSIFFPSSSSDMSVDSGELGNDLPDTTDKNGGNMFGGYRYY